MYLELADLSKIINTKLDQGEDRSKQRREKGSKPKAVIFYLHLHTEF